MLISGVVDENGEAGLDGRHASVDSVEETTESSTAHELFELMAKNHNFNANESEPLSQRDLVILYKNLDIGTQLMTKVSQSQFKPPNQHVETVVHKEDDSDDYELYEIMSDEDIYNVFKANHERLDLFNDKPSFENTLCHKLGDVEISSNINADYNDHFLFKDSYINEQLKNFKLINTTEINSTSLPASLLDFICCKRLEDNFNFYMDNIIIYVKHTIDQLKRISNGDYLTERAKEKWHEVESEESHKKGNISKETKMLATNTSIPLHVERKHTKNVMSWDEIVHSEVDIRSLSKILEKQIILEIPRMICDSYELRSKTYADNLVIRCKSKYNMNAGKEEKNKSPRVDLLLQLKRSESGKVISDIKSIMILNTAANPIPQRSIEAFCPVSLQLKEPVKEDVRENKIVELEAIDYPKGDDADEFMDDEKIHPTTPVSNLTESEHDEQEELSSNSDNEYSISSFNRHKHESGDSSVIIDDILHSGAEARFNCNEDSFQVVSPDELRMRMQTLNKQETVAEESDDEKPLPQKNLKKKSPTRIRIKSPYENKSLFIEEKKRKRLLEIRERREKNKIAMGEKCKIVKTKFGKGSIPQPSNSVTRLSITNKSFYNSIYGETLNMQNKRSKSKNIRKLEKDGDIILLPLQNLEGEVFADDTPFLTPEKNGTKYIDRSYYLDDAETAMMQLQNEKSKDKEEKEDCLQSESAVSGNELQANLELLSHLIASSSTDLIEKDVEQPQPESQRLKIDNTTRNKPKSENNGNILEKTKSVTHIVKSSMQVAKNTLTIKDDRSKKPLPTVECRKSIDKIYDLMMKLGERTPANEKKHAKTKFTATNTVKQNIPIGRDVILPGSDSGTSLKHLSNSSNHSSYSLNQSNVDVNRNQCNKNTVSHADVLPKVIINSKPQTSKLRKERKPISNLTPRTIPENPLKAISQLLQEFENVQKNRHKQFSESKSPKRHDDGKGTRQVTFKRNTRAEQQIKEENIAPHDKVKRFQKPNHLDKKNGIIVIKPTDNISPKKKIADLMDEEKEARGEAVKGPSKNLTRLNALAQPKKTYVQAHSEEYHSKYGRTLIADRLQRLAHFPAPNSERNISSANSRKLRKGGSDGIPGVSSRFSAPPMSALTVPIEKARVRKSPDRWSPDRKSPERKSPERRPGSGVNELPVKKNNVETPENYQKMVAVESYVKNHYGHLAPERYLDVHTQKLSISRAPLLPNDIASSSHESSPTEGSTAIGGKLHQIINTMLVSPTTNLSDLTERSETNNSELGEAKNEQSFPDESSRGEEMSIEGTCSLTSDYPVDVFEDKTVATAVEDVSDDNKPTETSQDIQLLSKCDIRAPLKSFKSLSDFDKLEITLKRNESVTSLQKKLGIKELILKPKHSMNHLLHLQSGDACSLVPKSTLKITASKSESLKDLTRFTNNCLDWNIQQLPMQIATVGFMFPEYCNTVEDEPNTESKKKSSKCNKSEKTTKIDKLMQRDTSCLGTNQTKKEGEINGRNGEASNDDVKLFKTHKIKPSKPATCLKIACPLYEKSSEAMNETMFEQGTQADSVHFSEPHDIDTSVQDTYLNSKDKTLQCLMDNKRQFKKLREGPSISEQATQAHSCEFKQDSEIKNAYKKYSNGTNSDKKKCHEDIEENTDDVNYTNSLDILVGLLNEIHKITTCQTNITNTDKCEEIKNNEFDNILRSASILDKVESNIIRDVISLTSIEKLRQLKSSPSALSFYLSDDCELGSKIDVTQNQHIRRSCDVKQINVEIPEKEFTNAFTDSPSIFLPITVDRSTSNSIIDLNNITQKQSLVAVTKRQDVKVLIPSSDVFEMALSSDVFEMALEHQTQQNNAVALIPTNGSADERKICNGVDTSIKVKRDILVTVYSVLVFTVFAALSVPEVLYRA